MHFVTSAQTEHKQEVRLSANSMNQSNSRNVLEQGTCTYTGCWENITNVLTLLFILILIKRHTARMAFHLLTGNNQDLTSASTSKTNTKHRYNGETTRVISWRLLNPVKSPAKPPRDNSDSTVNASVLCWLSRLQKGKSL